MDLDLLLIISFLIENFSKFNLYDLYILYISNNDNKIINMILINMNIFFIYILLIKLFIIITRYIEHPMKYSWKNLKEHIHNGRSNIVFERNNDIKIAHEKQREIIKSEYVKPGDFIKITFMKWRPFKNSENKIFAVRNSSSLDYIILENTFPYNLRKGIKHYNLFSVTPLNENKIHEVISSHIKNKEYLWFVNYPIYQSIPDLWHCHFFYKS